MGINPRSPGSGGRRGHRDAADIGASSQHTAVRIYKRAADQMPKMILETAFGEERAAAALATPDVPRAHRGGKAPPARARRSAATRFWA
jgi:hypothetical protein